MIPGDHDILLVGEATLRLFVEGDENTPVWSGVCVNALRMGRDYQSFTLGQGGANVPTQFNQGIVHTIEITRPWAVRQKKPTVVSQTIVPVAVCDTAYEGDLVGAYTGYALGDPPEIGGHVIEVASGPPYGSKILQLGPGVSGAGAFFHASPGDYDSGSDTYAMVLAQGSPAIEVGEVAQVLNGDHAGYWRYDGGSLWVSVPLTTTSITESEQEQFAPAPNTRFVLQIVWLDGKSKRRWQRTYRGVTVESLSEGGQVLELEHGQRFRAEWMLQRSAPTAAPELLDAEDEPVIVTYSPAGSTSRLPLFNLTDKVAMPGYPTWSGSRFQFIEGDLDAGVIDKLRLRNIGGQGEALFDFGVIWDPTPDNLEARPVVFCGKATPPTVVAGTNPVAPSDVDRVELWWGSRRLCVFTTTGSGTVRSGSYQGAEHFPPLTGGFEQMSPAGFEKVPAVLPRITVTVAGAALVSGLTYTFPVTNVHQVKNKVELFRPHTATTPYATYEVPAGPTVEVTFAGTGTPNTKIQVTPIYGITEDADTFVEGLPHSVVTFVP